VARKPFIIGLGLAGLVSALATFGYVRRKARVGRPGRDTRR
jgi:hypothetical protein